MGLTRIDGNQADLEQYATAQVQPAYPEAAQKYRIEGVVKVQVAVNRDGKVTKAEFLRGHSVFKLVSLEAAKQWQFKPPDNRDIEGIITFTFKLKS
jgi:TonB family protein